MICITEEAKELLNEMIQNEDSKEKKLTLASAGAGCNAPAIKIEMRPPLEEDREIDLEGIQVRVRPSILKYLDETEIVVEDTFWGKKLKVVTGYGCT